VCNGILEHDPEKVGTGFPKRSCSNKKIERDDDSKKSHPARARSIRLWELPNAEAANPASARRGSGAVVDFTTTFVAATHNGQPRKLFLFEQFQFALPPDWNPIILLRKVGIGPVGARPLDKRELPP
jgi:hypothetical protein